MKILFIATVLMAAGYLFLPSDLTQLLPQTKIEQTAETLLIKVDQKLDHLKNEISAEQQQKIDQLTQNVATLTKKLHEQTVELKKVNEQNVLLAQHKSKDQNQNDNEVNTATAEFTIDQQDYAQTQYLAKNNAIGKSHAETSHVKISRDNANPISANTLTNKQLRITRQAKLQDIADRMNNTSLMALTNN
jgi:hypothetical protein